LLLNDLTERTQRHVRTIFRPSDVEAVERILVSRCGANLPGFESASSDQIERIRAAVVRISAGRLNDLSEAVQLAELDWRDVLVAAGFAEDPAAHLHWQPQPFDVEVLNRWFAGSSLPGVTFSMNDPVIVKIALDDARPGSVISLEALEPEPKYLVELGSGADVVVFQRQLTKIA
jgi:hypothetical protein